MIVERNGIVIFTSEEGYKDHPAVKALEGVSLGDVRFPYGFFLVENNGKRVVIPGTAEDRRQRLLTAFPEIQPEALTATCDLHYTGTGYLCQGACPHLYKCLRLYDDLTRYYACACQPIW
jgi:hypothetical protein